MASDGFMRACLSTPTNGLAAMWALDTFTGPWRMDRLALGQHLGTPLQDTLRLNPLQSCRTVYILGDPTLRAYVVGPVPYISGTVQGSQVSMSWTAPPESVDGYFVYRGPAPEPALQNGLRNSQPISTTSFAESGVPPGIHFYAVRAVKLVQTGTGSFYNLSQAVGVTVEVGQ